MSEYVFDPNAYQEGYGEAEESQGYVNEPLAKGRYPLRVDRLVSVSQREGKAPSASMLLRVNEGPMAERTALVTLYLDASPTQWVDGEEVKRSQEERQKAQRGVQGRMKGFLKALGAPERNPVTASPENPAEFLSEFYGLDNLAGKTFVGEITVSQGKYNNLANFHPNNHEKYGLAAWREANSGGGEVSGSL